MTSVSKHQPLCKLIMTLLLLLLLLLHSLAIPCPCAQLGPHTSFIW
jgi:hypothetical protein